MTELYIYIKDLIRRYQFPHTEQESYKIDLLYHATAHFKLRKFVHNIKPKELTYDKMIEVAKAHERTCDEYQIHKQAHSVALPQSITSNKYFVEVFSERPSEGDLWQMWMLTTLVNAQPLVLYEVAVVRRRSFGRRHSSSQHTPSPRRLQQQRQRRHSSKQFKEGKG